MCAGDDESGPIDARVRRILSAEPADATYDRLGRASLSPDD